MAAAKPAAAGHEIDDEDRQRMRYRKAIARKRRHERAAEGEIKELNINRDDGHDDHHPRVPHQVVRVVVGDDDSVGRSEAAHLDDAADSEGHGRGDHHAPARAGG